jgi:hypothetical protein
MEYTTQYFLNTIAKLEDKLNRIEEIIVLTEINPILKLSMISGVLED